MSSVTVYGSVRSTLAHAEETTFGQLDSRCWWIFRRDWRKPPLFRCSGSCNCKRATFAQGRAVTLNVRASPLSTLVLDIDGKGDLLLVASYLATKMWNVAINHALQAPMCVLAYVPGHFVLSGQHFNQSRSKMAFGTHSSQR